MRPFSAFYFVQNNRWRGAAIAFMLGLTFVVYLAGLYLFNVEKMYDISLEPMKRMAFLAPQQGEGDAEMRRAVAMLEGREGISVLAQGKSNNIVTISIMGFHNGFAQYTFCSGEDFRTYCDYFGIGLAETGGGPEVGSVIMSRLQANNRGLSLSDVFAADEEKSDRVDRDYTLDALTDEAGYHIYYISEEPGNMYLLLPTGMDGEAFRGLLSEIATECDVRILDYAYYKNLIDSQLASFRYVYFLIILLLAVVLAVTTGAAFAGLYQHRRGEFALYRAIGISRRRTRAKIGAEVALLDVIGMAAFAVIVFGGIYLANDLYLYEHGFQLFYYDRLAFAGLLVSNLIVLVPVTVLQGRQLMRADICGD